MESFYYFLFPSIKSISYAWRSSSLNSLKGKKVKHEPRFLSSNVLIQNFGLGKSDIENYALGRILSWKWWQLK